MKHFASQDYPTKVRESGEYFLAGLRKLQQRHPQIGDVDGLGLALRMEMCEAAGRTSSRQLADRMFQIGLAGGLEVQGQSIGLVLDIGGYFKNVITLAPLLEITEDEIEPALAALNKVVTLAKAG